jgi:hypothetical protein
MTSFIIIARQQENHPAVAGRPAIPRSRPDRRRRQVIALDRTMPTATEPIRGMDINALCLK